MPTTRELIRTVRARRGSSEYYELPWERRQFVPALHDYKGTIVSRRSKYQGYEGTLGYYNEYTDRIEFTVKVEYEGWGGRRSYYHQYLHLKPESVQLHPVPENRRN